MQSGWFLTVEGQTDSISLHLPLGWGLQDAMVTWIWQTLVVARAGALKQMLMTLSIIFPSRSSLTILPLIIRWKPAPGQS